MKNNTFANWNTIVISLVIAVTLTMLVIYVPAIKEVDSELLKCIRKFLAPYPKYIPLFFSNFGGVGNFIWPQVAVSAVLISHRMFLRTFLVIFLTQGSEYLVELIKNIVCRERPCVHQGYSFPSGHVLMTTCLYGIVIYLIMIHTRSTFWRYTLAVMFGLIIFFVGLSRMWLGVHYLTDVLAGFFIGLILVNLFIILDKFFAKN